MYRRPRRHPRHRLATLLTAVLAATLLGTAAPSTAEEAPDPDAGAPAVDECFDVTLEQGLAKTLIEEPVACSTRHTFRVTEVPHLPDSVAWTDERSARAAMAAGCLAVSDRVLGAKPLTKARTLYQTFMFRPTQEQVDGGARWYTCGLTLWEPTRLFPLPDPLPRLARQMPDSVERCIGPRGRGFVPCAQRHTFRAVHAFSTKAAGSDRKVERIALARAQRGCRHTGRTGRHTWSRTSPSKIIITCFRKTAR